MPTPSPVTALVAKFTTNRDSYASPQYSEMQLRKEFLDPFIEALGWDVANRQGFSEAYKEVIHEDTQRMGTTTRVPDYALRVGGVRKFFVEAKKPSVDIHQDPSPAFQLRRYAWSAKLPLSVLTDFQEFAVYDCRQKPSMSDKAGVGRLLYVKYTEYESRWEEIAGVFSKEAVLKGSFDKYAETTRGKKGTAEVDAAFLAEIESWRDELARTIALRNPRLTQRELNFAVQRTIDRIVFLRICEDRGIEEPGALQAHLNGEHVYKRLCVLFREADERYNSGLFHFRTEKERDEAPDSLTLSLHIDDKPLKDIIAGLYYPESPYEFSVLPADILGQVYEQFLGKVIRLTAGHRAVVEDKPEVKKAGGVFYTPTYIVDYIVKNTVGRLLPPLNVGPVLPGKASGTESVGEDTGATYEGQPVPKGDGPVVLNEKPTPVRDRGPTPKDAAKLRILDPACGSGTFLIGAYQYLLDWHRDWYVLDGAEKWTKGRSPSLCQTRAGEYRLTTAERKRILLNNIYGVDIDSQAVEVTKLSLLLKVLEGENQDTLNQQLKLFRERALPDLGKNIKCGNSLIANDVYQGDQVSAFGTDEKIQINAFDWHQAFPEALAKGGFDAVIGNPPYDVLEKDRGAASWPHAALSSYVRAHTQYEAALGGKLNLFRFFVVKGLSLTRPGGCLGMIVPLALLGDISCARPRRFLLDGSASLECDCFPQKDIPARRVFVLAKLSTMVFVAQRRAPRARAADAVSLRVYPYRDFTDTPRRCTIRIEDLRKIDAENLPVPLVSQDQWTLCLKLHEHPAVRPLGQVRDLAVTRGEINQTIYRQFISSNSRHKRLLKGVEVGQFYLRDTLGQGEREWFDEKAYLARNNPKAQVPMQRIATQRITGVDECLRIVAMSVEPPVYFADSTNSVVLIKGSAYSMDYVLALLNSDLFQWRFKLTSTNNNVATNELAAMPFRTIDFAAPQQKHLHDRLSTTAGQLRECYVQMKAATGQGVEVLQRQARSLRASLNEQVFALYVLDAADIRLVRATQPEADPSPLRRGVHATTRAADDE